MPGGQPLEDLDLLVLGPSYQSFVKNQVDVIARQVNSVTVFVRYNRFADVAEYLPLDWLRPHRRSARIDDSARPANVEVVPIPLYYLPIEYHYDRLGAKLYNRLVGAIDEHDVTFDLIHAHFTHPSGSAAARLSAETGVPYVLTSHENEDWLAQLHTDGAPDVERAWREAEAIVRVNEKDAPLLRQYNDDVRSIPNGFSRDELPVLDRNQARRNVGIGADQDLVFGLGAMQKRKRWGDLLEAMALVAEERGGDSVTCAIAGRGPEKSTMKRRVSELGLEEVVSVLGYIPQSELASWMNAADIFALASESEGNPTVLFEALGCGTPYVGTNVGGVPEIITSEEYGLLCPPGDPETLAERLLEGFEREWDRDRIREYGEQFTWDRVVDRLFEVYMDVLDMEPALTHPEPL